MAENPEDYAKIKRSVLIIVIILLLWMVIGCEQRNEDQGAKDLCETFQCMHGGIVRADTTKKSLTLVFTGDEFADGARHIADVLARQQVKAAFFFTGNFYRNAAFADTIHQLKADGHYLGAHSDRHLLYCSWENRDSLLVTKDEFLDDLATNYKEMEKFGISKNDALYFLPPYEWYNGSISQWTRAFGLHLINFTAGTRSNADYTTPEMPNYHSTATIYDSIIDYEKKNTSGLNGFLLLIHIGTAPERMDKFYVRLEELIEELKGKGYTFKPLNDLLSS